MWSASLASQSDSEPVLQVRGLVIDRLQAPNTTLRVVDDVSFQIEKGAIVGLFGESGCGKTALALALLRLLSPSRYRVTGSIRVQTRELTSLGQG
jgi:peptide/nickel transport system ATP-binding protein